MWNVIIIDKVTKEETILGTYSSEEKADSICEMWGWMYDDGHKSYWMGTEEAK